MKTVTPTESQKRWLAVLLAAGLGISAAVSGVFLTSPSEGYRTIAYPDPGNGTLTVCRGHTGKDIIPGKVYTKEECEALFVHDMFIAEGDVAVVIHTEISPWARSSLTDFAFNVGRSKLQTSTMARLFNSEDYIGGCYQLVQWVYAGGKKLKGLEVRRQRGMDLCLGNTELIDVYNQ